MPKGYDAYDGLLADDEIDAIAVNTPPRFHEEMVIQALDVDKHVICEKPLSTSVEGCHRIRDIRDDTGLVVLPAHNYSFTPVSLHVGELEINNIEVTGDDWNEKVQRFEPPYSWKSMKAIRDIYLGN